jgi:hypothetical protein
VSDLQCPLDEVIEASHVVTQDLLDIIGVEEGNVLVVTELHDNLVWRTGPHGLKLQLTSSIVFAFAEGIAKSLG